VALIAEFLGVGAGDAELQRLAVEQSSIEAMRQVRWTPRLVYLCPFAFAPATAVPCRAA
jgi:hypothetical protein